MFSLFRHSVLHAKRIFWFSLIEWTFFIGAILLVAYSAGLLIGEGVLAIFGYIGIGFIFLPLSQIRGVLLNLGETGSLEVEKIMSSIKLLFRFWGVVLTVPLAISLVVLLLVFQLGFLGDIDLTLAESDPITLITLLAPKLVTSAVLQLSLGFVFLVFLFTFSSNMVPFTAIAANLGTKHRGLDPFFGFGAYKFKAFFLTLTILIVDAVILTITLGLTSYVMLNAAPFVDLDTLEVNIPLSIIIIWSAAYLVLIFVQNIWFSACALLFTLHKQDAAQNDIDREHQMYGHQFDDQDLRSLRLARQKRVN